jgi:hypothetical protein
MSRPVARRLFTVVATLTIVLAGAATALGNVANPDQINQSVDGMTLTLSGTWTWPDMAVPCKDRWVGWAVDWGVSTEGPTRVGHQVGTTAWYVGEVGQPGDNAVHTNQDCGVSSDPAVNGKGKFYAVGQWGEISHLYTEPGEYKVCVLMYDIHLNAARRGRGPGPFVTLQPKSATELIAGGTTRQDHNQDNSAEKNGLLPDVESGPCISVEIGGPTAPDLSTQASTSATTVWDDATFVPTGGNDVTGTVQFYVCGPTLLQAECTAGDALGSPVQIAANHAQSTQATAIIPGYYCFRAVYDPLADPNYVATSHSDDSNECIYSAGS